MCKALTKKGKLCKRKPSKGSDFCYLHEPDSASASSKEASDSSANTAISLKYLELIATDATRTHKLCFTNPLNGESYIVIREDEYDTLKTGSVLFNGIVDKNTIHTMKIRCDCQEYLDDIDRLKKQHRRKYENLYRQIEKIKEKRDKLKVLYSESIHNVSRLKTSLKASNKKANDLELRLSNAKKQGNISRALSDFAILDEFINAEVERRTGRRRDYTRRIYNGINDFIGLPYAQEILNQHFPGISTAEFKETFLNARDKRVAVAHPPVNLDREDQIIHIQSLLNFSQATAPD